MAATRLHDQSGEFFDVRIGPLLDAWDFDGSPHVPGSADIDSALSLVRDGGMFVAGKSILLAKNGMRFDVREFVEGYVFDRIAEQLRKKGFRKFVIHSPRVWRTVGTLPDDKGFELKLSHPFIADSIWTTLTVSSGGFAYLSPTRNLFSEGGKRYHSLLNPYTGMPGDRLAGVVIAADDAATAQAMAYAEFVRAENDTIPQKGIDKIKGTLEIRSDGGSFTTKSAGSLAASFESSH
jgi:thiamine biosynthesis lipoprotein